MSRVIPFAKAHACGNDFLLIEETHAAGQHAAMAQRLCARHTGVGADGIEFLDRRVDGSLFLRLFNADGSEAELSGNGTRCVAAWLAVNEGREQVELQTHGGPRRCRLVRREAADPGKHEPEVLWIETGMGVPRVMERRLQVAGIAGEIRGAMVNVGNPHFVIFPESDDFSSHGLPWQELGARISTDLAFRFGTNVEFVKVLAPNTVEFRIFERGCGPTESSGTGTCASAAAAISFHGAERSLTAVAPGGAQEVVWPASREEMLLTGPAAMICQGEVSW